MTFDLTFELRLIIVALSAFTAATLAGSAVVAIMWRRRSSRNPEARASSLLRWRLAPTTAAVTATLLASAAFVVFEQRGLEDTGLLLQFLAAITPILVAAAAWRAWRIHRTTRRTLSEWMATAEQIVLPGISRPAVVVRAAFPVVAIVGVFRPRLVIAKSVVDACSPEEIEAILAHEQRHIDWHDNLRRAFFWTAPDVFAWLPISQQMLYAWHDATEEAADEQAARLGPHGSLNLAQALIRVARISRMTTDGCDLPASALFRGEDLDARVRRLISSPSVGPPRRRLSAIQGIALALLATMVAVSALGGVHELIELAVTVLP